MNRPLIRFFVWLGLTAVFTTAGVGIWMLVFQGSQTTASLKWLQFLQTVATFLLPAIVGAWLWADNHKPFVWLRMNRGMEWKVALLAVTAMVCAIPGINLLADLNSRVQLPESLGFIEQILRQQEEAAAALTERFLQADNIGMLLVNIGLLALLPALAEETAFRGTLQQIAGNTHAAVWITAFLFSAVHMQFYGFVPRMLMGAMFGYIFVWTGSLWVPILMHATNNGLAVLCYYLLGADQNSKTWADTIGTGAMWWLGIISIVATGAVLYRLYRRTQDSPHV